MRAPCFMHRLRSAFFFLLLGFLLLSVGFVRASGGEDQIEDATDADASSAVTIPEELSLTDEPPATPPEEVASETVIPEPPIPSHEEIFAGSLDKIVMSRSGDMCTWELSAVKSEEIIDTVKTVFEQAISDGRLKLVENRARNTIIANFPDAKDFKIKQEWTDLMQIIDKPAEQVLLEILIVELVINDINQWGANLRTLAETVVGGEEVSQLLNMAHSATAMEVEARSLEGFKYYVTNGNQLKALVFSGQTKNKVRVLSSPQIIASNHKQAQFKLGRTLPILTGSTVSNGVTTYSYENKDIGINIMLTPHLHSGRDIGLEISQELNDLLSYDADKRVADFAHKTLTSNVTLGNGQTVALGGYIQSSDRVNRKSVPGLSNMPFLGKYFNRDLKTVEKVEVIVFITPKILTTRSQVSAKAYHKQDKFAKSEKLVDAMEKRFVKNTGFYGTKTYRQPSTKGDTKSRPAQKGKPEKVENAPVSMPVPQATASAGAAVASAIQPAVSPASGKPNPREASAQPGAEPAKYQQLAQEVRNRLEAGQGQGSPKLTARGNRPPAKKSPVPQTDPTPVAP
jgi:Flp pilus assembly secretin CpaC